MKYTIISIEDPSREEFRQDIREKMAGIEEVKVTCLDARPKSVDLNAELAKYGLEIAPRWIGFIRTRGDIGGLIGHYNAWQKCVELNEPLLVFEDDAQLPDEFRMGLSNFVEDLPEDYGFLALSNHPDMARWYDFHIEYDEWGQPVRKWPVSADEHNDHDYDSDWICYAYQSYIMTATLYSPAGAAKLTELIHEKGVHMNADGFIFHQAHLGHLTAFAPYPWLMKYCPPFYQGQSLIRGRSPFLVPYPSEGPGARRP